MSNDLIDHCVFCKGVFEEAQPTNTKIDCSCGKSFSVRTYLDEPKKGDE